MEYLPGGSLADRLKAGGPLSPREAAAVVKKLASAVAQAHARGVVHRDIKPANVMLAADGEPRLTDFGLAKVGRSDLTGTGAVLGTPAYMSPEQAAGKVHEVGPAADVYALGAMLYDLLTGRPPFRGDSIAVTLQQVLTVEPGRPRALNAAIPRDLETVCLKCLEKEPAKRYESAQALVDDLERVLAGEPVKARRAGTIERASRWVRRNRVAVAVALLVGTLSVALGVVASRPKTNTVAAPEAGSATVPTPAAAPDDLPVVVAELDRTDPGWRLEQMDKARRVVPPAENSARVIDLVETVLPPNFLQQHARILAVNDKLPPTEPLPAAERIERSGPVLLKARLAMGPLADRPYGRFPLDWNRDGLNTLLPHGERPRHAAALLQWSAISLASRGECNPALADCRGCLNAGRSLHDEPTTISQLVRIACATVGIRTAGRVLALGEGSEKELIAFVAALRAEDEAPIFPLIARSERAMMHRVFAVAESDMPEAPPGTPPDEAEAFKRLPKGAEARVAHAWSLRFTTRLVAITLRPTPEWIGLLREWEVTLKAEAPPGARDMLPAAGKLAGAVNRYTALLRSTITAVALERYRMANGRWPDALADLVPTYLPAVPTDPEDAAPLRYRRLADGVVVYGVGTDLKDDGGAITPPTPEQQPADVGFRLWNPELRGQGKPDEGKE